jgi:phenylacetate-CoA ligase
MSGVSPTLLPELLASLCRPFRSRRAIERYRAAALRRLVEHAWRGVPFYRRRFELHGLTPADIRTPADLERLPPVERRELQEAALGDRMATGVDLAACVSYETSGSSGEPLRVVRTRDEDARLFGRRLRAQIFSGLRPWHLRVNVGSPRRIFRWHRLGAFRILTISKQRDREPILDLLRELDPEVLMIAPESLERLLAEVEEGRRPRLRQVFSGANQLRPSVRRRAEQLLGARVTDFYGTTECNLIAWQCHRCGRYHTVDDAVIVEVVGADGRAAGPGESGEVVLTTLHSFAMPFIRLRLGDLATRPARAGCAVHFGALERIEGRIVDYLHFSGGRRMNPFELIDALEHVEGLGRWQAVQHDRTHVELRFEPLRGAAQRDLAAAIEASCRALFPEDVTIEVRAEPFQDGVTGADAPVGAKHRFIRSLVGTAPSRRTRSTTPAETSGIPDGA